MTNKSGTPTQDPTTTRDPATTLTSPHDQQRDNTGPYIKCCQECAHLDQSDAIKIACIEGCAKIHSLTNTPSRPEP